MNVPLIHRNSPLNLTDFDFFYKDKLVKGFAVQIATDTNRGITVMAALDDSINYFIFHISH